MKKPGIFLLLFFALAAFPLFAQDFSVPEGYRLEKADDYSGYEQDVIDCVEWMLRTPLNEEVAKRKEAEKFLFKWISGSPTVSVDINPSILTFMESSPSLLIIFLGGWTKYALETGEYNNKVGGNLAGLEAVIGFYEGNRHYMEKDKNVEKYIKLKAKGRLREQVEKFC